MIPFDEINERIWTIGAEIFTPCAASRLVTQSQIDSLIANGLEVKTNVLLLIQQSFWPYHGRCDHKSSLIPDFISNCGMARICLLYGKESSND
jgi:glutamate dehydrogenase/leucine dehydrogenase